MLLLTRSALAQALDTPEVSLAAPSGPVATDGGEDLAQEAGGSAPRRLDDTET